MLSNGLHVLAENNLTLLELSPVLTNLGFRTQCLRHVTNNEIRSYFENRYDALSEAMQQTMSAPVLNKLTGFTVDPKFRHLVGQQVSTFSIRKALEHNQQILLNLSKGALGEQAATFGSLFLSKLKSAVFSRKSKRLFTIYADEVQNLVSSDAALEVLFSECRKFAVSVVCSNQYLEQIPTTVRSAIAAIGTHIYFQLSPDDSQHVAHSLDGGKALAESLKNLPPRNFIVKSGSIPWRQAQVPHVVSSNISTSDLYNRCRNRWTKNRTEIEAEILRRQPTIKATAKEALDAWK